MYERNNLLAVSGLLLPTSVIPSVAKDGQAGLLAVGVQRAAISGYGVRYMPVDQVSLSGAGRMFVSSG
jgi:hypothetical protein